MVCISIFATFLMSPAFPDYLPINLAWQAVNCQIRETQNATNPTNQVMNSCQLVWENKTIIYY